MKPQSSSLAAIAAGNTPLRSVNIHITKRCNLSCTFCFATFDDVAECGDRPVAFWIQILRLLAESGTEKVNFAGGEPTLYDGLGALIRAVKALGMTSSIVTNGARLKPLLEDHGSQLDWVGLSVDSAVEDTQRKLGRGKGLHVSKALELSALARARGCRLKLNTVVTSLNVDEDMSDFVHAFAPERWKVFQVLKVEGQNNGRVEPLLIGTDAFSGFIDRHAHLTAPPIAEDNDAMVESYVMIDPLGRFFSDSGQRHTYSEPIPEAGVQRAYEQVIHYAEKTAARGGYYDWESPPLRRAPFVVVEGLDGVGKSTVARELVARLDAIILDTPGARMRELRWSVHNALDEDPNALCLLYLATVFAEGNRAQALVNSGTAVVMDRYWLSTVAYGVARGATVDLSAAASAVPRPDLTVVLEVEEGERIRRLRSRGPTAEDKLTYEPGFAAAVRAGMANDQPPSWGATEHIDVTGLDVAVIVNRILIVLQSRLRNRSLPLAR